MDRELEFDIIARFTSDDNVFYMDKSFRSRHFHMTTDWDFNPLFWKRKDMGFGYYPWLDCRSAEILMNNPSISLEALGMYLRGFSWDRKTVERSLEWRFDLTVPFVDSHGLDRSMVFKNPRIALSQVLDGSITCRNEWRFSANPKMTIEIAKKYPHLVNKFLMTLNRHISLDELLANPQYVDERALSMRRPRPKNPDGMSRLIKSIVDGLDIRYYEHVLQNHDWTDFLFTDHPAAEKLRSFIMRDSRTLVCFRDPFGDHVLAPIIYVLYLPARIAHLKRKYKMYQGFLCGFKGCENPIMDYLFARWRAFVEPIKK